MDQLGKGVIPTPQQGIALAIGCGCGSGEVANALRAAGCSLGAGWVLVTDQNAPDIMEKGDFPAVIRTPYGQKNNETVIAQLTAQATLVDAVVLVIGADVPQPRIWDMAFFCANLPSRNRYVIADNTIYLLSEFVNIFCKPTEQEWADSDGEAIACTLYGNVGKSHSGLHSLFLGKEAYERFIDSYYLEDLLKTKYYGHLPEKFYYMLYFALLYFQQRNEHVNFTELGATLWATMDKIDRCHLRLKMGVRPEQVEWISIELSDYLRRLSHLLHPDRNLTFFDRWQNFLRNDAKVGFSHLVTPYAFHDEHSVVGWVKKFGFCLWVNDFTLDTTRHLRVNGKKWTLLSLTSMLDHLRQAGMDVFYVDAQNLDAEGQIKRATLIVCDKNRFVFEDYLRLIADSAEDPVIGPADFRTFDFDPMSLWQKIIKDEAYFEKCANDFSAGFAGALAICPTEPYELRWSSPNVKNKIDSYLHTNYESIFMKNQAVSLS